VALVEDNEEVQTLTPDRAETLSAWGFCQGERGAVVTSVMPITPT